MCSAARSLIFINGLLFIFILPGSYIPGVEICIKIAVFSITLTNMISAYLKQTVWVAFYLYIISLFYNPWFIITYDMERAIIADVIIGLSILLIGIFWNKIPPDRRE